jgi:hypothetical protein
VSPSSCSSIQPMWSSQGCSETLATGGGRTRAFLLAPLHEDLPGPNGTFSRHGVQPPTLLPINSYPVYPRVRSFALCELSSIGV